MCFHSSSKSFVFPRKSRTQWVEHEEVSYGPPTAEHHSHAQVCHLDKLGTLFAFCQVILTLLVTTGQKSILNFTHVQQQCKIAYVMGPCLRKLFHLEQEDVGTLCIANTRSKKIGPSNLQSSKVWTSTEECVVCLALETGSCFYWCRKIVWSTAIKE